MEILPLRAYASTKSVYDDHCQRGAEAGQLPQSPLMAQVLRNDFELQIARRRAAQKKG